MAARKPKGKAVEVDGITVDVTIDPADDYGLAACSAVISDPDATAAEKTRAIVRQHELVLGDSRKKVMEELRKRNGGKLPGAAVSEFCNRVIAQAGEAKN